MEAERPTSWKPTGPQAGHRQAHKLETERPTSGKTRSPQVGNRKAHKLETKRPTSWKPKGPQVGNRKGHKLETKSPTSWKPKGPQVGNRKGHIFGKPGTHNFYVWFQARSPGKALEPSLVAKHWHAQLLCVVPSLLAGQGTGTKLGRKNNINNRAAIEAELYAPSGT